MKIDDIRAKYARHARELQYFAETHTRILIIRRIGGIGDIINSRMIFQDLKAMFPSSHITYALPPQFMSLVQDHPFIDDVADCQKVQPRQYGFVVDITDTGGMHEAAIFPNVDLHRADIWANVIGLTLTHHETFLSFTPDERAKAKKLLGDDRCPVVAWAPYTSQKCKDYPEDKWQKVVSAIAEKGYRVLAMHSTPTNFKDCDSLPSQGLRSWMAVVAQCDYVLTPATGLFCVANALHIPTVAVFGCEDLDVYGRYFPEMIAVQQKGKDWPGCPCWSAWKGCPLNPDGPVVGDKGGLPKCLLTIQPERIIAAFDEMVTCHKDEYYNEDYFQTPGCKGWYDRHAFALDNSFHKDRARDTAGILGLQRRAKTLDVGCALGNVPHWLGRMGFDSYGVDISQWAVEHSHLDSDRIRWADISDPVESLPYPEHFFDAVTSREVMEHIEPDNIPVAIENMVRMLKPGGVMLHWIATNRSGKEEKKRRDPRSFDPSHVCIQEPQWWIGRFQATGLKLDCEKTLKAMNLPASVRFGWDAFVLVKGE
jgi:ubiquinone/menaquinone biosynthesis C-methylase UbiE